MIVGRLGYLLLANFKHVIQRSDTRRDEPWHALVLQIHDAKLLASVAIVKLTAQAPGFTTLEHVMTDRSRLHLSSRPQFD